MVLRMALKSSLNRVCCAIIIIMMFLFPVLHYYFFLDQNPVDRFKISTGSNYPLKTDWCSSSNTSTSQLCKKLSSKHLRLAYAQYATTPQYLCNSLITFSRLRSVRTEAELVLIYPEEWDFWHKETAKSNPWQTVARLLEKVKDMGVILHPTKLLSNKKTAGTWSDSFTKLKILGLKDYDRIIYFDSDGLVMKNMDHLFFSPLAEIALPQAYWLNDVTSKSPTLTSHFMIIMPSYSLYRRMLRLLDHSNTKMYDMEIMNQLAGDNVLLLPHQSYAMLSGEYRKKNHSKYLSGSNHSVWDADREAAEAHYVHFSDWPLAKPWIKDRKTFALLTPRCPSPTDPCRDRYHWLKLYKDFQLLEQEVCSA